MDLSGMQVAVVGLGKSGVAAARLCLSRGGQVIGLDEAPRERLSVAASALEGDGVRLVCGPLERAAFGQARLVMVSPGVPQRAVFDELEAEGVEVVGELELASRFVDAPMALIGGTNGKSTVTALVGAMVQAAGRHAFVGGNFGTPLCEAVQGEAVAGDAAAGPYELLVVEISSFQAERVPTLHAKVHALLNISEDHLDRYPSFQAYADAKGNPFERMTADDVAVIPAGDAACAAQAARGAARVVTFSNEAGEGDVSPAGDALVDGVHNRRFARDVLRLRGRHNLANACAAIAVAGALGVQGSAIEQGLATFGGLDHRSVLVAEIDGVRFYDDSKATNVGAAVAALRGLEEERAVLIAGGRDKQGSYDPLVAALGERGRALVLIGEAADRLAEAASGRLPIERATSMHEAVERSRALAQQGDAVLLSPACSSFDMFESYKHRGRAFADAVRELGGER
jgi:UDP-N-acetylmuramoylalanine--D-glutamate ligase